MLNGKMHGFGSYEDSSGIKYSGEWKEGKQHGEGKCVGVCVCARVRVCACTPPFRISGRVCASEHANTTPKKQTGVCETKEGERYCGAYLNGIFLFPPLSLKYTQIFFSCNIYTYTNYTPSCVFIFFVGSAQAYRHMHTGARAHTHTHTHTRTNTCRASGGPSSNRSG